MSTWLDLATSRPGVWVTNIALAALWGRFAVLHVLAFLETDAVPLLLFVLSESLIAVLFLIRKRAVNVSDDLVSWAVGIAGTFAPFLFVPSPGTGGLSVAGGVLILLGVSVQFLGVLSLNRSFGIVPAEREIKTTGLYRMVRHPIYMSYLFTWTGYLLVNGSWVNALVFALAIALTVERVRREERLLLGNEEYRQYVARVPYRLIPYVW